MEQDDRVHAGPDPASELEDTELLEARRRKLGEKLLSRGLITVDPLAEDEEEEEEEEPAEA